MEKMIEIEEGRQYLFRASAFSPIQYNKLFKGQDYLRDIEEMAKKSEEMGEDGLADFSMENYEQFVRLAYTFAYQGLSKSPRVSKEQLEFVEKYPTPWAWIDSFDSFAIYRILPDLVGLWIGNEKTLVEAKNQQPAPSGK